MIQDIENKLKQNEKFSAHYHTHTMKHSHQFSRMGSTSNNNKYGDIEILTYWYGYVDNKNMGRLNGYVLGYDKNYNFNISYGFYDAFTGVEKYFY